MGYYGDNQSVGSDDKLSLSGRSNDNLSSTGSYFSGSYTGTSTSGGSVTTGSIVSGGSNNNNNNYNEYSAPVVARKEQRNVRLTKLLVFVVLLLAVVAVATTTYLLLVNAEHEEFENQFAGYASEVVTVARQKADQLFDSLDAFSVALSSQAIAMNASWPFVTIQDWSSHAQRLKVLTGTHNPAIVFSPIVEDYERPMWIRHVLQDAPKWYADSIVNENKAAEMTPERLMNKTLPFIHFYDPENGWRPAPVATLGQSLPAWQTYPLKEDAINPLMGTNYDLLQGQRIADLYSFTNITHQPSIGFTQVITDTATESAHARSQIMQPIFDKVIVSQEDQNQKRLVGVVWLRVEWIDYFKNLLVEGTNGIIVVLKSSCPRVRVFDRENLLLDDDLGVISYRIDGSNATYLGEIDAHDPKYDYLEVTEKFVALDIDQSNIPEGKCIPELSLHVYPSEVLEEDSIDKNKAVIYTIIVICIFIFPSLVFLLYDHFVRARQRKVMERIIKQDKIVSNVFPAAIRDRLYQSAGRQQQRKNSLQFNGNSTRTANGGENSHRSKNPNGGSGGANTNNDVTASSYSAGDSLFDPLDYDDENGFMKDSAPLADLFPNTTIVFADIAGFTAWSSAREPPQVFMLLESIYGAFDKLAYRHGVFKVETVGDCYVAVAGLPEPNDDHALAVASFARDCLKKMKSITRKLEVVLGPDTSDLDLRVGLHSGQVTAGVLRGQRSRFQLFGDTMNTAARMESTSERNRIQITSVTADLLRGTELGHFVKKRENKIFVKGKGEMQTYWICRKSSKSRRKTPGDANDKLEIVIDYGGEDLEITPPSTNAEDSTGKLGEYFDDDDDELGGSSNHENLMTKKSRLIEWNVEILSSLLQQILAAREDGKTHNNIEESEWTARLHGVENDINSHDDGKTVLDEFIPIIPLKRFDASDLLKRRRPSSIELDPQVKCQLRNYITNIADMYLEGNSFHNFEHASHVTASVKKLLTRIVKVDESNVLGGTRRPSKEGVDLQDLAGHSYGITSDPLTQFTVVFSAVIHDVDHPGVPNTQLVKENTRNAKYYKKSIAEQNSVDLAWEMLMGDEYTKLRSCIYQNEDELKRFRQLLVNTVLATDICDKELQALRKNRWERAFAKDDDSAMDNKKEETKVFSSDRKATIVIEHLIQASDVSHTMQHWHIYKEWNKKFFMECYGAYKEGRADSDPSVGWYKGEIGFFDFYIIPLAKKLDSCGVFGVSSDEYLSYAQQNRDEWEREGENIVQEYIATYGKMQKHTDQ